MATYEILQPNIGKQSRPTLTAVQHIRRMRGGSQAHLLAASDGHLYITELQNNPQHVRGLANEFFATRLAGLLGSPVSEAEIITVPEWLLG